MWKCIFIIFKNYHCLKIFFKVVAELESVEKEAAFDYLKVENEVNELNDQITKSDAILG